MIRGHHIYNKYIYNFSNIDHQKKLFWLCNCNPVLKTHCSELARHHNNNPSVLQANMSRPYESQMVAFTVSLPSCFFQLEPQVPEENK